MTDARNRLPKRVRPGDSDALRRKLWRAILAAELLLDHDEPEIVLRAVNSLGQTGNVYRGLLADGELEAKVAELEQRLDKDRR